MTEWTYMGWLDRLPSDMDYIMPAEVAEGNDTSAYEMCQQLIRARDRIAEMDIRVVPREEMGILYRTNKTKATNKLRFCDNHEAGPILFMVEKQCFACGRFGKPRSLWEKPTYIGSGAFTYTHAVVEDGINPEEWEEMPLWV